MSFNIDPNYVWKTCKILKNSWIKNYNVNTTQNLQKGLVSEALDKICPPWVETNPTSTHTSTPNEFFDRPFDYAEFNAALDSKNTKSSPGLDGIDNFIIKKLPIQYHLILLDIFNELHSSKSYPESWRHSFLHFISKPDGKSLRPIALTSAMCKLFESLHKNRLQWWVESKDILPDSQHGFRQGRSCTDSLLNLTLKVDEALLDGENVVAAFLDVKGAFDNVNIDILLAELSKLGCSDTVIEFVKFLTHSRFIHADCLEDDVRSTYKGVPQGGVLSSLLYIIYVATITKNLHKSICISQFADDIALYVKSKSVKWAKNTIEKAVHTISTNLKVKGLDLAPEKTQLMHFNKKQIHPGTISIKVQECIIKSSKSVKFLGIHLDYQPC